jgi:hypothetical protein
LEKVRYSGAAQLDLARPAGHFLLALTRACVQCLNQVTA